MQTREIALALSKIILPYPEFRIQKAEVRIQMELEKRVWVPISGSVNLGIGVI